MRLQLGRVATLSHTFYDENDESILSPSVVTYSVYAQGVAIAEFTGSASISGDGFNFQITPTHLGQYSIVWDADGIYTDTTYFEIVGPRLFTLSEARSAEPDLTLARFPTEKLLQYRDIVEQEFERITHRSFVTRRTVDTVTGGPNYYLGKFDIQSILSVEIDGVVGEVGDYAVRSSAWLSGPSTGTSASVLTVGYDYGVYPPPDDVKRAGIQRMRWYLLNEKSGIPDRATVFESQQGGTYTLAVPGRSGWETGMPDVDSVLNRYKMTVYEDVMI